MRLVILGASGGCGAALMQQALARGHEVTAVVRPSSRLEAPAQVKVLRGDLGSAAFLQQALAGQDAVLSALGLRLSGIAPWSKAEEGDFLERSTRALVEAMRATGVKRAIAIGADGVGESRNSIPVAFRVFVALSALRKVYEALERMERIYLESGLEVCICRPTGLTDEPATGRVVVAQRFTGRATIPRADVAGWMLDEVVKPSFAAHTPMITVTGAA